MLASVLYGPGPTLFSALILKSYSTPAVNPEMLAKVMLASKFRLNTLGPAQSSIAFLYSTIYRVSLPRSVQLRIA